MVKLTAKFLITVLALFVASEIIEGVSVSSTYIALIVAVMLGIFNLIFKPILLVFTLPINILTLGLFSLVINAFIFYFISTFVEGFVVEGVTGAFLGALVVTLLSFFGGKVLDKIK